MTQRVEAGGVAQPEATGGQPPVGDLAPEVDGGGPPAGGPIDGEPREERPGPPRRRGAGRDAMLLVGISLVIALLVRTFVVQAFYIPSGSMEPTLEVGDRVLVSRVDYALGSLQRGDVIVFDGADSFTPEVSPASPGLIGSAGRAIGVFLGAAPDESDFVKRVIGLPGDRVACCDVQGRLMVNGMPLTEPYVMPGDAASTVSFDVIVPPGRIWVMGDHRSASADSRAHLGDPGGGTVPEAKVVGRVVSVFWPLDRLAGVGRIDPVTGR